MKTFLKIAGITLLIVLLALIILPFLFKGKIIEFVKNEINQTVNARVDFDRVGLNFFKSFPNASVSLDNLKVIGTEEFEMDTLLFAKSISATVNLKSLFGNSGYEITKIFADQACLHAHVLESGKANWDIMKEETTEAKNEETSAFKLLMKEVNIRNSDVYFDNDSSHINMALQNINLDLTGDMTADKARLKTNFSVETLSFLMDKIPYLSKAKANGDAAIDANWKDMKFTFAENKLQLNEIKANLDGWVSYPDEDSMDMDIRLNAPETQFKDILSLIPAIYAKDFDKLKTSGKVSLEASAKGVMKGEMLPAFDTKLQVSDAFFQYPGMPESVKNIRTNIHAYSKGGSMDNTIVDISDSHFEMAGNPFDFQLYLSTPISDANIRLSAQGNLDLGKVKSVYPLENMDLNGNLSANMKMATRMSFIEKEQYDKVEASGTLNIKEMQIQSEGKDNIQIHNAGLSFSPRYVDLSDFSAEIGKNDLTANGKLENFIPYFMKNETLKGTLTVNSNYLNLNDFMSESNTSSANDSTQIGIIEIPKNLDFNLTGNFKQLVFDRLNMTQVAGQIIIKDGKAEMKNLAMNALGGKMNVAGYYDTGKNPQQPEVSLNLDIQEVSFAQTFSTFVTIKQLAPIFENLAGNYSTKFQMVSPLNKDFMPVLASLTANGLLSSGNVEISGNQVLNGLAATLKNESLKDLKIKDLKLPFSIDSGRVSTKPFDVRFGDGNLNLQGSTGLDQTINYTAKVNLTGKLANQYMNNVTVLIGGTFTNPKFSLDVKNAADQLLGNLANSVLKGDNQDVPLSEQVTGKINEQIEKQTETIRKEAKDAGDKLVAEAEKQGQKLIDEANKTSNAIAKIAAVKAAESTAKKLKDEAQKQADKLSVEAEKQIQTLKDKAGQ